MHWKLKAKIQNAVSRMPSAASYEIYYWIQRQFGRLGRVNPSSRLKAGIAIWKQIQRQGTSPVGKVFLEVGTGRAPLAPLSYWLLGAEKTITIDLNPYLKEKLIKEHLRYISQNETEISELFGSMIDRRRFSQLLNFTKNSNFKLADFLELCRISYIAPGDAANTNLPEKHIDFHTSWAVFEHIPSNILSDILIEGNRIIKPNGLFVHRIDYSDHFSHSDNSISAINFLQYSDNEWAKYADNRYMYMNRLRHDDFLNLFNNSKQTILITEPTIDTRSKKLLEDTRIELSDRFRSKSREILAISGAWILSRPKG